MDIGLRDLGDALPANSLEVGAAEVGIGQIRAREVGTGQGCVCEIDIGQIGMGKVRLPKGPGADIRRGEMGVFQVCAREIGTAQVGGFDLAAGQIGTLKFDARKVCAVCIDANQRDMVTVQFLQSGDATAVAALALGGIDDLPSLVVAQLATVPGTVEVEDNGDEDGKVARGTWEP